MKKILIAGAVILAVLVALSLGKDMVAKAAVEKGVEMVTGLRLQIGGFGLGVLRTVVDITNLKLFNPAGFQDKTMLDMPKIYVNYDLPAIIGGTVHLRELRLDMKEFVVVKNAGGQLNLDSLKAVQAQKTKARPAAGGKAPKVKIDILELKIGKVVYKDYTARPSPSVKEFNINLNEKYSNIDDPSKLVGLIVVKALMNTNIAALANFDITNLRGSVADTLKSATKIVGDAQAQAASVAAQAQQTVTQAKAAAATAQESARQAQEAAKKTAESLQQALKNPFAAKSE